MKAENLLIEERRARMAAERLLAQKESELNAANRMLSQHAVSLSEEVVEKREEVEEVKGENQRVRADLERANSEIVIAKRRLWNSIQSIEDGFAVFDADSRMVIANTAYLKPFDGLECIRPGVHYRDIVKATLEEGVVDIEGLTPAQWRDLMLERWEQPSPEPRVIRLWDGTWIRLIDQHSRGGDTVALGLNITEEKRRMDALTQAREKAEAATRAKSAFLANMSHEIRTPMNGVVGMADLLAESKLDDEQALFVDTIRRSGQSLLAIINDVLDFSKLEAAKFALHTEPFDLEQTLFDVLRLMEPGMRSKDLLVSLDYDKLLPTCFEGDPVRLRQILTNLIGNAVKFTPSGRVEVRISGQPGGAPDRKLVRVSVEDTGIGIAADKLDHVFGEFNQVEDERNRSFEGTGLGLAITRQLVELMEGRIWVESEPGFGSVFTFEVPLSVGGEEPLRMPPEWMKHALVIMSDVYLGTILSERLRRIGLDVTRTVHLDEALATLRDTKGFDVVLIDPGLPGEGAADVVGDLRKAGLNAPVVRVGRGATGESDPGESDPGEDMPAVIRVHAPRAELIAALETVAPPTSSQQPATTLPAPTGAGDTPAAFAGVPMPQPAAEPDESSQDETGPLRQMKVLAAEDNKTNQLVFRKLVKACDIDLAFANNGAEAVAAYEQGPPDLIFMDISMPGMDGKEATRRIRAIEAERGLPHCPIVALTAHAMADDAKEILSHGLDAYLTKPFKKPAILAEISHNQPDNARAPVPQES